MGHTLLATLCNTLVAVIVFHQPTVRKFEDLVGQMQIGQSVGDHDHRTVDAEFGQDFVDQPFAVRVDLTGRLVENQDFWVAKDRVRQGNSLPLSTTETLSALAHASVVLLGKSADKLMSVRSLAA